MVSIVSYSRLSVLRRTLENGEKFFLLRTIFLVIFCFRVADKWRKELGEAEAKEMEAVCRGAIRSHEQLTMLA